ncbi:MAG: sigma-70 family RNA polymerase sigma factor [Dehalococcoidales bacterium]|nr:sigma-70 family RNA polymerase sigma factor [Dehalococcoidales bacterium]
MKVRGEEPSLSQTFADLYEEYLPRVFRYVKCRVNDVASAEDLTSSVFEKAVSNFARYNRDKAAFSTWIFTIARNTLTDYYRVEAGKKKQHVSLEEAEERPANIPSPPEELERKELAEKLSQCVAQLSPEEQEIIHLRFEAELTNREIAKIMGFSESNVGVKLYRAIRKMRDSLQRLEYVS